VNLARRLTEAGPGLRWQLARPRTLLLYRRAFAHIGDGTVIVAPRVLRGVDRISIGDGCAVYSGAWLACEEPTGSITIGDGSYLGHDVHVHSIDPITIGRGCVLADGAHITTSDHDRDDRLATHGTGATVIGDHAFIGQRAVVLGGITIGAGATVGAHAVVTRDVPAGAVVGGVPARVIGGAE
jgi:acetyltransferase-like isoleucine patch superfamily enzyme